LGIFGRQLRRLADLCSINGFSDEKAFCTWSL
jgi:hypothetical protein